MTFALSKKYSEIDFEYVSLTDLVLIGGGCGGGGGGGGSTTVTSASVQAAAQSAAAAPGANSSVGNISFGDPVSQIDMVVRWSASRPGGGSENGTAFVNMNTGVVSTIVMTTGNSGGGFWSSVGSFFSWLFGSH